ncbi:unnamed protein product [Medioppia subpectinata]|uniref:Small ribosomal subunit protein uS7 domain-containing protein n=1 Tax=Medioppia subpectinata TaxID=1979941 RepID=A0A7R9Q2D9_9ACAR|nr:unnamed protein product [Medioppia subpectinata]CAG2110186.1 unnamed protein product [Medioppia subpectinata]
MAFIYGSIHCLLKSGAKIGSPIKTCAVGLSQWSPQFAEPVLETLRLEEMQESGELHELAFKPIKARQSSHSCSLFYDNLLNRFISKAHLKGEKTMMRDLMRQAFGVMKGIQMDKCNAQDMDKEHIQCDPLVIFHTAIANCRPMIITRPIKRGGATYQVPYPLKVKESEDMAMRWIIHAVRDRPKPRKTFFPEVMAKELIDAFYNEGKVVKKKQDVHRVCDANRAYAHYRWG